MTSEVVGVEEMATLGEIADLLERKHIKRVPVVHDGKIVGIVSRADRFQVLASGGAKSADDERDRTSRGQLLAEPREQKWADDNERHLVAPDGVVHFWGLVGSEEDAEHCVSLSNILLASEASKITRT
jgi:CBS-domain-containing membrane protein